MDAPLDARQLLEVEVQRVYGARGDALVVQEAFVPEEEVRRALAILRTLPDGAGHQAIIRAFGIQPEGREPRDA